MKFDRRTILKSIAGLAGASSSLTVLDLPVAAASKSTVSVIEVTTVLPDLIRVELREPAVGHRGATHVGPGAGTAGSWVNWNGTWGLPIGPGNAWLKLEDIRNTVFLDRAIADDPQAYGLSGGRNIRAVYRKSIPWDWGECYGDKGIVTSKTVSMRHLLYLHLDGDLPPGEHRLTFPSKIVLSPDGAYDIAPITFAFDDGSTRCAAIKCNQVGFAPRDNMKYAFLAEWVPGYGEEGQTNYSFVRGWHLIDESGSTAWSSPSPPELRVTPDAVEDGSAIDPNDVRLTSTTKPVRKLTGYTIGGPCIVSYEGPALAEGTIIRFENIHVASGAPSPLNCEQNLARNFAAASPGMDGPGTFLLMKLDAKTGAPTEPYTAKSGEEWSEGGTIYETNYPNNRAGTYVYGLDFSSFVPETSGTFRIKIPGLGVSHPFRIDNAVWHDVAAMMAAGEYSHRHAIDLDDRFGYPRPAGFSPKAQTIFRNLTPLHFSNEIGRPTSEVSSIAVTGKTSSPMHTSNTVEFAPGHHDAGDHDSRIGPHAVAYYGYMDFFEKFPEAAAATKFRMPSMTELYPGKEIYAGTEKLPDCLQQAMFAVHGYIEGISPDGEVCGGVNWSSFSSLVPSWLVVSGDDAPKGDTVFVYGPDHVCGYILAGLLAKLALCLKSSGQHSGLADYYEQLALKCWNRAELVFDNESSWSESSSDAVAAARTQMYDTGGTQMPGGYKTAADFLLPGSFEENFAYVQKYISRRGERLAASAILFRLTGDAVYERNLKAVKFHPGQNYTDNYAIALYEYASALTGQQRHDEVSDLVKTLEIWTDKNLLWSQRLQTGFKPVKRWTTNGNFGNDGTDWGLLATPLVALYVLKEALEPGSGVKVRNTMLDGWSYGLGANLTGKSLVTGLGSDSVAVALHNDSSAMGVALPKGIMLYGPARRNGYSFLTFTGNSPLNYLTMNSRQSFTTDFEHFRRVDPTRFAWPRHEHFFESPSLIEMAEYVYGGNIGPQQWIASVLWATSGTFK
jgi:endoglucanase